MTFFSSEIFLFTSFCVFCVATIEWHGMAFVEGQFEKKSQRFFWFVYFSPVLPAKKTHTHTHPKFFFSSFFCCNSGTSRCPINPQKITINVRTNDMESWRDGEERVEQKKSEKQFHLLFANINDDNFG